MKYEGLKTQIRSRLKGYDVYFSSCEIPIGVGYPRQWQNFGLLQNHSAWLPDAWIEFSGRLPWVHEWLQKCVVGTVIAISDKPFLGYIYLEDGEVYIYLGGTPVEHVSVAGRIEIPSSLRDFYLTLHNGFGFYLGLTMGPSPVEDFMDLQDLCGENLITLPRLGSFFSSGAGDYLATGLFRGEETGYIWWHETPTRPEADIDIWSVMNTWMAIFLENSDSNDVVFD
jgi:hypothetical protein